MHEWKEGYIEANCAMNKEDPSKNKTNCNKMLTFWKSNQRRDKLTQERGQLPLPRIQCIAFVLKAWDHYFISSSVQQNLHKFTISGPFRTHFELFLIQKSYMEASFVAISESGLNEI